MQYKAKIDRLLRLKLTTFFSLGFFILVASFVLFTKTVCMERVPPLNQANNRPNIIFIMADDLGYGDLGSYGQQLIHTPRLDRMASEGMRFTNFYSGSSICAPSRCSLLTGMHQGHAFIRGNSPAVPLRPQDVTVAQALKGAGYATGVTGKWGMGEAGTTGSPISKGFDYSFGFLNQKKAQNHFPETLWRNEQPVDVKPGSYAHDLFTQDALDYIKREQRNPFFLYLAYTIPHGPFQVPDKSPYKKKPWPKSRKSYAAMVTRMDSDIGRILDLLQKLGIDDNTIVFFTSDNGAPKPEFFRSNSSFAGTKRNLNEGGIRVPLIARWPGRILPGQVGRQPWALWDIFPTLLEIAGVSYSGDIDGSSHLAALLGNESEQKPLYWETRTKPKLGTFLQAVRMDKWKAIRRGVGKPIELYDLEADEGETVNVAALHPDIVKLMENIIEESHEESQIWPSR